MARRRNDSDIDEHASTGIGRAGDRITDDGDPIAPSMPTRELGWAKWVAEEDESLPHRITVLRGID